MQTANIRSVESDDEISASNAVRLQSETKKKRFESASSTLLVPYRVVVRYTPAMHSSTDHVHVSTLLS